MMAADETSARRTTSQYKTASEDERARIRRNQQNSRARRRAYVEELEHSRDECQRLGCNATEQTQNEIRRVREENIVLRALLKERGVDDAHIANVISYALGDKSIIQSMPNDSNQQTPLMHYNDRLGDGGSTDNLEGRNIPTITSDDVFFNITDSVDDLSKSASPFSAQFQGPAYDSSSTGYH